MHLPSSEFQGNWWEGVIQSNNWTWKFCPKYVEFGLFFSTSGIWKNFTWSYLNTNLPQLVSQPKSDMAGSAATRGVVPFHYSEFKSPLTNAKNGGVIIHPSINPSNQPPIQANRKHSLASSVPGVWRRRELDQHLQTLQQGGWEHPWN